MAGRTFPTHIVTPVTPTPTRANNISLVLGAGGGGLNRFNGGGAAAAPHPATANISQFRANTGPIFHGLPSGGLKLR